MEFLKLPSLIHVFIVNNFHLLGLFGDSAGKEPVFQFLNNFIHTSKFVHGNLMMHQLTKKGKGGKIQTSKSCVKSYIPTKIPVLFFRFFSFARTYIFKNSRSRKQLFLLSDVSSRVAKVELRYVLFIAISDSGSAEYKKSRVFSRFSVQKKPKFRSG